jgi:hypothetical protein
MAKSIMDQIRALDEQKNKLLEGAKSEAMEAVNSALTKLNALGFSYRITGGKRSGGSQKGTRQMKAAACPVCGFKTEPPHDGRAHRGQKDKKPFTAAELRERGYERA